MSASLRALPRTVWAWHLRWHIFPREVLISLAQLSLASENTFAQPCFLEQMQQSRDLQPLSQPRAGVGDPPNAPPAVTVVCFWGVSDKPAAGPQSLEKASGGFAGKRIPQGGWAAVGGNGIQVSCSSSLPLRPCGLRNAAHPLGPKLPISGEKGCCRTTHSLVQIQEPASMGSLRWILCPLCGAGDHPGHLGHDPKSPRLPEGLGDQMVLRIKLGSKEGKSCHWPMSQFYIYFLNSLLYLNTVVCIDAHNNCIWHSPLV